MKKLLPIVVWSLVIPLSLGGQDRLVLGGSVSGTANFFMADSLIGADHTPQYDHQLFGSEAWVSLNAAYKGFDGGIRFDMYNNSNLIDPKGSYSGQKIGRWFVRKSIKSLHLEAGYLYDQIGSGIIYRAYEERSLAIDNALYGIKVGYDFSDNWKLSAFTGRQKNLFDLYSTSLRGGSLTGFVSLDSAGRFAISPGIGIVGKTLSDATMDRIVAAINTYTPADSVVPYYNTYALAFFNTLTAGPVTWYVEAAYKTPDAMFDPLAVKHNWTGKNSLGKIVVRPGHVLYTTLAFNTRGLGVTLEGKRTQDFNFRVDPFVTLNRGALNFLPPMARSNTYTLTAYYAPATQEFGEQGAQLDIKYSPNRKLGFGLNLSHITDLKQVLLYQEVYADFFVKHKRKWKLTAGTQLLAYNLERYYNEPGAGMLHTVTPFVEYLYRITRRKSLRVEAQYMRVSPGKSGEPAHNGSWAYGLLEFNIAPHWSFSLSDMINVQPGEMVAVNPRTGKKEQLHYPRVDVFYTEGATRLSLSYVKQVEGIVCTGGVCRLEPAFSGVKMTVNAAF